MPAAPVAAAGGNNTDLQIAAPKAGINKPGFIDNSDGSYLRTGPREAGGQTVRDEPLPPATRVFVSGTHPSAPAWWYITAALHDKTMVRGYVQGHRVNTDLPEPLAELRQLVGGETAEGLAREKFGDAVTDGHDLRYYENVLRYVNRGRAGITGTYQDPGVLGGGSNNIQLVAGHRIWLVSAEYAKALQGVVPSGSLTGGAVAKARRFAGHLQDILHSVTESTNHFDEVAGEFAQAIRDHLPEIVGITAGFLMAEAASMFLAAAPTGVSQAAAVVIQLTLAAFGAAGMVQASIEALKHGTAWLTIAWTAHGKHDVIAAASREFLRMLVAIAMAALGYLGVRGNYGNALKIARSMPVNGLPAAAMVGSGSTGTAGAGTGMSISGPGFARPAGIVGAMMTKHQPEGESNLSEGAGHSKPHNAESEPAAGSKVKKPQGPSPNLGSRLVTEAEGGFARVAVKGSPQAMADWVEQLPSTLKQTNTPAAAYEARVAGPKNYEVRGGGERVNADGVDIAECELLEAKHVGDLQKNPWLHPERLPERVRDNILDQLEDEFRRYAGVIKDPTTPAKGLRVIVSDAAAKSFFEQLMSKYGILGKVVVQP